MLLRIEGARGRLRPHRGAARNRPRGQRGRDRHAARRERRRQDDDTAHDLRADVAGRPARSPSTASRIDGAARRTRSWRSASGTCPEGRRVFPRMSVLENLQMGAYHRGRGDLSADLERVFTLFPVLQGATVTSTAATLSGGEQQMLAIGRALMGQPRLLLLDEPSMGLAPMIVARIFEILREINAQGTTILLVEQNAAQALRLAGRGYVLETGAIALARPVRGVARRRPGPVGVPRRERRLASSSARASQLQTNRHKEPGTFGSVRAFPVRGRCLLGAGLCDKVSHRHRRVNAGRPLVHLVHDGRAAAYAAHRRCVAYRAPTGAASGAHRRSRGGTGVAIAGAHPDRHPSDLARPARRSGTSCVRSVAARERAINPVSAVDVRERLTTVIDEPVVPSRHRLCSTTSRPAWPCFRRLRPDPLSPTRRSCNVAHLVVSRDARGTTASATRCSPLPRTSQPSATSIRSRSASIRRCATPIGSSPGSASPRPRYAGSRRSACCVAGSAPTGATRLSATRVRRRTRLVAPGARRSDASGASRRDAIEPLSGALS